MCDVAPGAPAAQGRRAFERQGRGRARGAAAQRLSRLPNVSPGRPTASAPARPTALPFSLPIRPCLTLLLSLPNLFSCPTERVLQGPEGRPARDQGRHGGREGGGALRQREGRAQRGGCPQTWRGGPPPQQACAAACGALPGRPVFVCHTARVRYSPPAQLTRKLRTASHRYAPPTHHHSSRPPLVKPTDPAPLPAQTENGGAWSDKQRRLGDFSVVDEAGIAEPVEGVEYAAGKLFLSGERCLVDRFVCCQQPVCTLPGSLWRASSVRSASCAPLVRFAVGTGWLTGWLSACREFRGGRREAPCSCSPCICSCARVPFLHVLVLAHALLRLPASACGTQPEHLFCLVCLCVCVPPCRPGLPQGGPHHQGDWPPPGQVWPPHLLLPGLLRQEGRAGGRCGVPCAHAWEPGWVTFALAPGQVRRLARKRRACWHRTHFSPMLLIGHCCNRRGPVPAHPPRRLLQEGL